MRQKTLDELQLEAKVLTIAKAREEGLSASKVKNAIGTDKLKVGLAPLDSLDWNFPVYYMDFDGVSKEDLQSNGQKSEKDQIVEAEADAILAYVKKDCSINKIFNALAQKQFRVQLSSSSSAHWEKPAYRVELDGIKEEDLISDGEEI